MAWEQVVMEHDHGTWAVRHKVKPVSAYIYMFIKKKKHETPTRTHTAHVYNKHLEAHCLSPQIIPTTHTHTLSLSLSLTHTERHTDTDKDTRPRKHTHTHTHTHTHKHTCIAS